MKFRYSTRVSPPAMMVPVSVSQPGKSGVEKVLAKIDTGACISIIPEAITERLRFQPGEEFLVKGMFDVAPHVELTYYAILDLGEGLLFKVMVLSSPRDDVLLGRDILNRLRLHADGPHLVFELDRT